MDARKHAILTIFAISSLSLSARAGDVPMRHFFQALRQVETGGEAAGGRDTVGDQGRSIGPYQIQWKYWHDSGVAGRYEHVKDARYAERVMVAYWQRYCPDALARGDWRTLARVHNGGPGGDRNPNTWKYWLKVRHFLESP